MKQKREETFSSLNSIVIFLCHQECRHFVEDIKGNMGNTIIIIRKVLDNFMTAKNICSFACS